MGFWNNVLVSLIPKLGLHTGIFGIMHLKFTADRVVEYMFHLCVFELHAAFQAHIPHIKCEVPVC